MSFYSLKQKKNIVLGVTVVLGLFIIVALKDVFTAFLGAIIFYVLFRPLYLYLTQTKNYYKSLSAVLIIIISFLIIVLPLTVLCFLMVNKIIAYTENPADINNLLDKLTNLAGNSLHDPNIIKNIFRNIQSWALGSFATLVNEFFAITVKITVMYFVLYFMFVSHETFEATVLKYMPFKERNSMIFAEELRNITYSNVLGQGFIAIIQGALVGLGFLIFGLKDPVFWGVISTFLSFLPVVGAPLVFVPAGLIAFSNGDNFAGSGIILWGFLIVTNIDNVLRFLIAKRVANTHPLITIIGVVIGIPYFGILGLVFGPLLLSYFILLASIYEVRYIRHKPLDISELKEPLYKPKNEI